MSTVLVTIVVAALSASAPLAQQWTAEQQEVISLTQNCWEAWEEESTASIESACPDHPRAVGWATSEDVPSPGWSERNLDNWATAFFPRTEPLYMEIRPLAVEIFGDTALYHFWALWTEEGPNGEVTTWTRKQLDVWSRAEGRWQWIGGMQQQTTQ